MKKNRFSTIIRTVSAWLLLAASPVAMAQQPSAANPAALLPLAPFAKLPAMSQPQLSPDARSLAYLRPINGQKNLIIASLDGTGGAEAIPPVKETDIIWFKWVNNERLIISYRYTNVVGGDYVRTALFSVHVKEPGYVDMAREPKLHNQLPRGRQRPQIRDRVIDMLPDDPDHFLLAIDSDFDGMSEVRKVNVATGRYANVTTGYDWIRTWITDQKHEHRIGWGMSRRGLRVVYIDPESNSLQELNDLSWFADKNIQPIGFTEDSYIAYAIEPFEGDRKRLITFDIRTGKPVDVIYERADVDVDSYYTDPESGRIVGAGYTDDFDRVHYLDPELAQLQTQLDQWLPGGTNLISSWNRKKQIYVVHHVSDREDVYYLLDLKNGGSSRLSSALPFPPDLLAKTKRFDIKARDGVIIPSYLTLPNGRAGQKLPLIVMPHGGPHSRDTKAYDYQVQFLANRGYAVLQPNFRGSSGFGYAFELAGKGQWGGKMQDDVTDATRWAINAGMIDADRICIVGASYGGYAAFMGVIKEPDLYACAVSISGVADLKFMADRLENSFWNREYAETMGLEGEGIKAVSPYHRAENIQAPVLIIHAEDDPVVPFKQAKSMAKRLRKLKKDVTFLPLEAADHYMDTEQSRLALLRALEKFLRDKIGN